jgi:hypothetical protein
LAFSYIIHAHLIYNNNTDNNKLEPAFKKTIKTTEITWHKASFINKIKYVKKLLFNSYNNTNNNNNLYIFLIYTFQVSLGFMILLMLKSFYLLENDNNINNSSHGNYILTLKQVSWCIILIHKIFTLFNYQVNNNKEGNLSNLILLIFSLVTFIDSEWTLYKIYENSEINKSTISITNWSLPLLSFGFMFLCGITPPHLSKGMNKNTLKVSNNNHSNYNYNYIYIPYH